MPPPVKLWWPRNGHKSNPGEVRVAVPIAENLHPVANPAIDGDGNVYVTFSGSRGQKVPVAIYRIDTNYNVKPFLHEMMNATGLALDRDGSLYVSSRYDGTVYRVAQNGTMTSYAEGMGIATGIAFDPEGNLYVGDRSGTIFKIGRDRQIFVFAMLEPSVSAYHLAFGNNGNLYVTGPTTSSFDAVHQIDPHGEVSVFYRGLGRPQGLAVDVDGNLYVAASLNGRRGIVKDHARSRGFAGGLRTQSGGTGIRSRRLRRACHHQRCASPVVGHRRPAPDAGKLAVVFCT